MSITHGTATLWDEADLTAVGGPYYKWFRAFPSDRLVFQWTLRTAAAAAPAAAFTFYSSVVDAAYKLEQPLDETNLLWTDETPYGAVFVKVPGTVADDSDRLSLDGNAVAAIMVKLDVLSDLTGFSLRVSGVG